MIDMEIQTRVKDILRESLSLGDRAQKLTVDSQLLGGIAEFDSMAVVTVIASLEEQFGITVEDDEMSADVFATVGSLIDYVSSKVRT